MNKNDDDEKETLRGASSSTQEFENPKSEIQKPKGNLKERKETQEEVLLARRIARRIPRKEWQGEPFFPNKWIMHSKLTIETIESVLEFMEKKNEFFHDSVLNSQNQFENLVTRIQNRQNNVKSDLPARQIDYESHYMTEPEKIELASNGERIVPDWLKQFANGYKSP